MVSIFFLAKICPLTDTYCKLLPAVEPVATLRSVKLRNNRHYHLGVVVKLHLSVGRFVRSRVLAEKEKLFGQLSDPAEAGRRVEMSN